MKVLLFLLLLASPALAANNFPKYTYDASSGNSYTTIKVGDTSYINGFNSSTGARWNSTYRPGFSYGTDKDGNYWNRLEPIRMKPMRRQ